MVSFVKRLFERFKEVLEEYSWYITNAEPSRIFALIVMCIMLSSVTGLVKVESKNIKFTNDVSNGRMAAMVAMAAGEEITTANDYMPDTATESYLMTTAVTKTVATTNTTNSTTTTASTSTTVTSTKISTTATSSVTTTIITTTETKNIVEDDTEDSEEENVEEDSEDEEVLEEESLDDDDSNVQETDSEYTGVGQYGYSIDSSEYVYLAEVIEHEGANCPVYVKEHIGMALLNRVFSSGFADSIYGCKEAPGQYFTGRYSYTEESAAIAQYLIEAYNTSGDYWAEFCEERGFTWDTKYQRNDYAVPGTSFVTQDKDCTSGGYYFCMVYSR